MAFGYSRGWTTKNHNAVPLNARKRRPGDGRIPSLNVQNGSAQRVVPFAEIQEYRRQHEQDGVTARELCSRTGYSYHTMRQWLTYTNRVHA